MFPSHDQDLFLVEQAGVSHKVIAENLMSTIGDNDLMLVESGGTSYKVTGKDVKDQLGTSGEIEPPVKVLTPPKGAGLADKEVTPAAEGISDVVENSTTEPTWSTGLSYLPVDATSTNPGFAFDGKLDTEANVTGVSGTVTITFNTSLFDLKGVTSLRVHAYTGDTGSSSEVSVSVDGSSPATLISLGGSNSTNSWANLASLIPENGTVNSIVCGVGEGGSVGCVAVN